MKKVIFTVSLASVFLFSCKKDDDGDPAGPTPITDVCNGAMGTKYFPLSQGDTYTFTYSGTTFDMVFKIYGKTTISGTAWAQAEATTSLGDPDTVYIAEFPDGSFRESEIENGEFTDTTVMIPANPAVGQVWYDSDSTKYEVTSVHKSFTTPSCTYSGLLEITETPHQSATPTARSFYKSGVGLVANECLENDCFGFDLMYLESMTLQP